MDRIADTIQSALTSTLLKLWPLFALAIVGFVLISLLKLKRNSSGSYSAGKSKDVPLGTYRKQSQILSKAELSFLNVLRQAAPPHTMLLAQVPLQRIVSTDRTSGSRQTDWNRINQKHVDFVVCDGWTRPLAVVELDDSSHQRERGQKRDALVDAVLQSAGVEIVHVPAANNYDVEALRRLLAEIVSKGARA